MPLHIADQTFEGPLTEQKYLQIKAALNKVPLPDRANNHVSVQTQSHHDRLTVLQGECGYINQAYLANPISSVATLSVNSCIFVMLYNDSECFVAHLDSVRRFNLATWLDNFQEKDELCINIIGGDGSGYSNAILQDLLGQLLKAGEDKGCSFTVVSKSLNRDHTLGLEGKAQYVYNRMIEKASYLKRSMFKKPLDLGRISHYSSASLMERKLPPVEHEELNNFCKLFFLTIYKTTPEREKQAKPLYDKLKINNEHDFYQKMDLLFTKECFQLFDQVYSHHNKYPDSALRNFVIDLNSRSLSFVSEQNAIPYSGVRCAQIILYPERFHEIFNSHKRHHVTPPQLHRDHFKALFEEAASLDGLLDQKQVNRLAGKLDLNGSIGQEHLACHAAYHIMNLPACSHYLLNVQNHHRLSFNHNFYEFYHRQKMHQNQAVTILNQVFGFHFENRLRRHPDTIADAVLDDCQAGDADKIVGKLRQHGLKAYSVKFADKSVVSMEAVNLVENAQLLSQLADDKLLTTNCGQNN